MAQETHLRLADDVKERLIRFAKTSRRTLNASAELLIVEALDRREQLGPQEAAQ